jgi:hypothetical protein
MRPRRFAATRLTQGKLLSKWPHPLDGNPNFVRGDWYGDGRKQFFWYGFKFGTVLKWKATAAVSSTSRNRSATCSIS